MPEGSTSYGLWALVILNSLIFIIFAFSFTKPKTETDWRSFGMYSAFIVALFVEMYGFPLTIYLFSGFLGRMYPNIDLFNHNNGHLIHTLLGLKGDAHLDPFHIASVILIALGFIMLASAWNVLYAAQKKGKLATTGLYAKVRHPQYIAFVMILFGFLLQWPTIITILMFPVLVIMYWRLAKQEEAGARNVFKSEWDEYASKVPAFFPRWSSISNEGELKP